jgi:hypothetical protein
VAEGRRPALSVGLFGSSAKDGASNRAHRIRVKDCTFVAHDGSQNTCAISTKTPTWGWEIGYCIQVKYQKPRPDHPGLPGSPQPSSDERVGG